MAAKDSEVWAAINGKSDSSPKGTKIKNKTDASQRRGMKVYKTK